MKANWVYENMRNPQEKPTPSMHVLLRFEKKKISNMKKILKTPFYRYIQHFMKKEIISQIF